MKLPNIPSELNVISILQRKADRFSCFRRYNPIFLHAKLFMRVSFRNHVMVATVTGIAPFISMLRYWLEGPVDDRRMYVLDQRDDIIETGEENV